MSLVAWSYAGHVAFAAALRRPDLFARILVYEPGVPSYVSDDEARAAFARDADAAYGPVAEALRQAGDEAAARAMIEATGGPGAFEAMTPARAQVVAENAHTMGRLFSQTRPPAIGAHDLAGLEVPTSIAWGEKTRPAFAIPSQAAAAAIDGGAHREVPGVSHLWPDEDPAGFSEMVEGWLRG